ncbi:hypothetical protein ADK38_35700, partial [Streptomyces varsoviensis]
REPLPPTLVTTDGRHVPVGKFTSRLHAIKNAEGQVIGHASHSGEEWAAREKFYANFRRDGATYWHYKGPKGAETPDGTVHTATDTTPWHVKGPQQGATAGAGSRRRA